MKKKKLSDYLPAVKPTRAKLRTPTDNEMRRGDGYNVKRDGPDQQGKAKPYSLAKRPKVEVTKRSINTNPMMKNLEEERRKKYWRKYPPSKSMRWERV